MARLRVNSSQFANNFARPLSLTRLPTPEANVTASESAEKLRFLLVSLEPPVSQSLVDEALNYLAQDRSSALAEDTQEDALKNAVIGQVTVGLYARGLEIYLKEATEIEAEAEWWANVEGSGIGLAWYLLQTLPSRLARVLHTILVAIREQNLPIRFSSFTPSSLFRLLPATAFRPSALTSSFFPHLTQEPSLSSLLWSRPSPSQYLQSIWSAVLMPFRLTREECRYKRKKLEALRDERAEQLGKLARLRTLGTFRPSLLTGCLYPELSDDEAYNDVEHLQLVSSSLLPGHVADHASVIQQLQRPSRLILLWPKLLLLPPLTLYAVRTLYASRVTIAEMVLEAKETIEGFVKNSLVDPIKDILKTVRTGGEDGVIVRKEGVMADLESLERMTLSLARDQLRYDSAQLDALSQKIRVGDLTPVLQIYEEDIKTPLKSALTGTLLRSMFIQVQKAKVDIDQALAGIDKLLKSQELTFAFVGLAPALVIVSVVGTYLSQLLRPNGANRLGGAARRASTWAAMRLVVSSPLIHILVNELAPRRIEQLLVSERDMLSAKTTGLLLISVTRLRGFAETSLPSGSRLRDGFLEDVSDLEDPAMSRNDKLRVVDRMWRSWGGVLGWRSVAAEGMLNY
ncbi:NCA2-domain-containing protein [Roridomyces roridus]|uniref:NCA2-domain-containing protein n=1 Tax=Roridomyces roridus TaxID=1738132 RepID=A0AAD7B0G0_9AGAR|nr:NCA2-domain-containing protein [Roridomyces roridus]KAJ7640981.1 NCA2-domain-containing protein [Roridomyces roridus]